MFSHIYKPQCPVAFRFGQSYPIVPSNNLLFDINKYTLYIFVSRFQDVATSKISTGQWFVFPKAELGNTHERA